MEENKRAAAGGVLAGLVGGLALSLVMILVSLINGQDLWAGMKFAALPFLGSERVMQPGFELGPVLLGLVCHFAVAAFWGLVFGLLAYGLSRSATVLGGIAWGLLVWLAMYYVVMPLIGIGELARSAPTAIALLGHLVFGLAVGVGFLPFQRSWHRALPPSSLGAH